jgi:protocatechuate 3,4-dioxygenase alpha subunit
MKKVPTPSQTVGPFFEIGLRDLGPADSPGVPGRGDEIWVTGRVLDGEGMGVHDALIELWYADAAGQYGGFRGTAVRTNDCAGFLRVATKENGEFFFKTSKPGRVAGPPGKLQAPHIVVTLFMRGLLRHLVTRIYFPDDAANAEDAVLSLVPESRRPTLLLEKDATRENHFTWNVILQGARETVFFDG